MWWWALPAALLVGVAVWGTSAWLLRDADKLDIDKQISTRIEAVRTALAAGAGVGAAVTLLLAVRRQRHQELADAHTAHDATERRVTELYTKAADQLGSDQAPVRLAGLYALERLGEHTPALQQTIVDVICAYLRMPFTPPTEQDRPDTLHVGDAAQDGEVGRDPREEHQVRLTAQRILAVHLRYQSPTPHRGWRHRGADPNARHWPDISLDLTGATLVHLDLNGCRLIDAWFEGATFIDNARFSGTTFTGFAQFTRATFTDWAFFIGTTFTSIAGFGRATFTRDAWFHEATFTGEARFDEVTFTGEARFRGVIFSGYVSFRGVTGLENAQLNGVRVVPATRGFVSGPRVWPPGWRVENASDGWQRLRRAADGDKGGPGD